MAVFEQQCAEYIHIEDDTENKESDMESIDSDDQNDPTYNIVEETRSGFSRLSIKKKSKSRISRDQDTGSVVDPDEVEIVVPELDENDKKSFENIQNIIQAGQLGKLKVDQCKVYLRKYGLRLTGNKYTLIQRILEHLEVSDGGGEKKYPLSSFVLNCKGDACTGDIVMFEQNVYDMFNIASRSASGPPCGTRIVAGRIVKESYGAAKQQHTFTIEVLWSKGKKPHPPLHPLLIKGRNLYRLKTLRQRWEDEGERQKALTEKHSRGSLARTDREVRMQEKEMRKKLKTDRVFRKAEPNKHQSHQFRKEEPNKNQTQVKNSANDSGKPSMQAQQMQPFQSHQEQISRPQYHLVMTGSRSSSTQKENTGLLHPSTKTFNSSTTEKLCSGSKTIQHREKESHHAGQRQHLTSMNHYPPFTNMDQYHFPPLSPTRRQNYLASMNQSTNQFPPLSPTRRQSHHTSTNYFHLSSPTRRQSQYPSTNQSTNNFPPLIPTRSQISHYSSTNQWQKQCKLQRQQPCRYYAQGRCYFGVDCKFSHELPP